MRIQYVTEDGKVFATAKEAQDHDTEMKQTKDRIKKYTERIDEIEKEIAKLQEERENILVNWKKSMPAESQARIDSFIDFLDKILGFEEDGEDE